MQMVSKGSSESTLSSKSKRSYTYGGGGGEQSNDGGGTVSNLSQKLQLFKKQIQSHRAASIKEKLDNNRKELETHVSQALRRNRESHDDSSGDNMLISRIANPLFQFTGFAQWSSDKDHAINGLEFLPLSSIKLPYVEKLPPYTTWIFLDRNQRMAEDQSVVGRRRIYYDQHGGEALICSDSEEDLAEPEEERHEFSQGEDRLLWMAFEENGTGEEVISVVSQFVGGTTLEIQERYKALKKKYREKDIQDISNYTGETNLNKGGICLYKSLNDALDSFDNLFCRICLQFDCRMHGCSPTLVYPMEKQAYWSEHDDNRKPCSSQCFLQLKATDDLAENSNWNASDKKEGEELEEENRIPGLSNAEDLSCNDIKYTGEEEISIPGKLSSLEAIPDSRNAKVASNLSASILAMDLQESSGKRKVSEKAEAMPDTVQTSNESQVPSKKQKTVDIVKDSDLDSGSSNEDELRSNLKQASPKGTGLVPKDQRSSNNLACMDTDKYDKEKPAYQELHAASNLINVQTVSGDSNWKSIEKELYMKGLEIFGRNSCLIARNMLSGLRTCAEVFRYMHDGGISSHNKYLTTKSFLEDGGKAETDCNDGETPTRSRLLRRKGKTRKLKYSWKSAGHPSVWKRIADGKNKSAKQYTPCGCQTMCGKECPCHQNGTCCEKYCGCSKSCKNRFRGCHCAKSQCRSRQCPCFAAARECDPDVCRNCWVSCGGDSLGEPPKRGDGQCGNMRLLLRQQQRILLARSDVAGWGAFLKNAVNKNDYLGEYTGELISHREADKRGKIYDRANSSFLFDLNDQYVLDAYRKGDKLKFANHSSNPNCHAKVMLVAGDHRVGIFAKERIEAGEELFYDYRYGPDQAPAWARKPEGSRREDSAAFQGRAKKHHSH